MPKEAPEDESDQGNEGKNEKGIVIVGEIEQRPEKGSGLRLNEIEAYH